MRKIFTAPALLLFCLTVSYSQGSDLFLSLEHINGGSDILSSAEVGEEAIKNKNTPVAADLVSSVTGVFVTKAASQIKSDVSIRGIGDSFRKIGLFIDGRPEKMSVYGCGVSQTLLSGNIERIEIVKGSDSVLFGGDALGGAVNIFTSGPKKPFEAEVSASYGTYNTQNYFAGAGGKSGKTTYNVSANKASSDGFLKDSGYNSQDYYAKFGYKADEVSEILVGGKYFSGEEREPKAKTVNVFGNVVPTDSNWYDFKRGGADIKYTRAFNSNDMEILAFGDWGEHEFKNGFHSKDSLYGVFAHFTNTSLYRNTLKYGIEYRLSDGRVITAAPPASPVAPQNPTGEWKKSEAAVFALDEYDLTDQMKISAGARYNYDEVSGEAFAPRAGVSYDVTDRLTGRILYSRGFRAPYINELYTLPISNKNLKPEIQNNYEIGVNSKYIGINFDASGYVINGDNIIQVYNGKFRNAGSYVFKGIEFSAEGEIIKKLKGYAGYSYLDPGDLTQGIAKNKIDVSLDYKIGKFSVYAGSMIIFDYYASNKKVNDGTKLEDFNVLNAKIHYNINDNFTVFAAADNITDQKYEMFIVSFGDARIYEMPGAAYTAGIKVTF